MPFPFPIFGGTYIRFIFFHSPNIAISAFNTICYYFLYIFNQFFLKICTEWILSLSPCAALLCWPAAFLNLVRRSLVWVWWVVVIIMVVTTWISLLLVLWRSYCKVIKWFITNFVHSHFSYPVILMLLWQKSTRQNAILLKDKDSKNRYCMLNNCNTLLLHSYKFYAITYIILNFFSEL